MTIQRMPPGRYSNVKELQDPNDYHQMRQHAGAAWCRFLESTPPNVSQVIPHLGSVQIASTGAQSWEVGLPRIQIHCDGDCGGFRGFDPPTNAQAVSPGYRFATYTCRDCGKVQKTFALLVAARLAQGLVRLGDLVIGEVEVIKLGEFPPFSAPISKRVGKLLGNDDLELYGKGTRAEAQGLGVGAASYFRRIVDNQWKLLVKEIRDAGQALGEQDLTIYDRALAETQFSSAVDMLKDAIPGKLLILDSQNPLTLLYKPLSVQLHDLSDGECLQQAADIRKVLTALLQNIADVLKDQQELKDAADRLRQLRS